MESNRVKDNLYILKHFCLSVLSCVLLLSAIWFAVWFDSVQAVIATPVDGFPQKLIAANLLKGMGDKLEVKTEQAVVTTQCATK